MLLIDSNVPVSANLKLNQNVVFWWVLRNKIHRCVTALPSKAVMLFISFTEFTQKRQHITKNITIGENIYYSQEIIKYEWPYYFKLHPDQLIGKKKKKKNKSQAVTFCWMQ